VCCYLMSKRLNGEDDCVAVVDVSCGRITVERLAICVADSESSLSRVSSRAPGCKLSSGLAVKLINALFSRDREVKLDGKKEGVSTPPYAGMGKETDIKKLGSGASGVVTMMRY
jgi:hypothetical protein